jgi:hypothetical protein
MSMKLLTDEIRDRLLRNDRLQCECAEQGCRPLTCQGPTPFSPTWPNPCPASPFYLTILQIRARR